MNQRNGSQQGEHTLNDINTGYGTLKQWNTLKDMVHYKVLYNSKIY